MEDQLDPNSKIKLIPNDTIVNIPISGAFIKKLQETLFYLLGQKEPTEVAKVIKELETREPNNFWEHEVTIYLALVYQAELVAKEGGHIIEKSVSEFLPKEDSSEEASPES